MDGTGRMFAPLIDAFKNKHIARVVNYPSHEAIGYEELVMQAFGAIPNEGEYFLLGESFSGPIAVRLAAQADDRLRGVILCCSFITAPVKLVPGLRPLISRLPVSLIPNRVIEYVLFGRFRTTHLSKLYRTAISDVADRTLARRMRAVNEIDVSKEFSNLRMPLLYLRATEDKLVARKAPQEMTRLNKQLVIVDIRGPHCLLQAAPQEAGKQLMNFMNTHGSDSA